MIDDTLRRRCCGAVVFLALFGALAPAAVLADDVTLAQAYQRMMADTPEFETLSVTQGAEGGLELHLAGRGPVACDTLLIHQGIVPNPNLARAAGCAFVWDEVAAAFRPETDAEGFSSVAGLSIAGDGAGIVGALGAEAQGTIAGAAIATRLGRAGGDAMPARQALAKARRGRGFLDRLYRPVPVGGLASDDTVLCRCETVTLGQIRRTLAASPVPGPDQLKAYLRCGMGPCQGRICGHAISAVIAGQGAGTPERGYYSLRPPVLPVPMDEIAHCDAAPFRVEREEKPSTDWSET